MKMKYKNDILNTSLRDFIWRRALELNMAVERLMKKRMESDGEEYIKDAVDKTLEKVIQTHGKILRKK